MSQSSQEHHTKAAASAAQHPVRCAVLTVSDTRTRETDEGGPRIARWLTMHAVHATELCIVRDDPDAIQRLLEQWLADPAIHVILITGGTGIARRDTTIEVVRRMLTSELEGFGELFRMLSYEQVQSAAMLSRAIGGLVTRPPENGGDTFIFAMPGSPNAVDLAMSKLIAPQLAHLVWERRR